MRIKEVAVYKFDELPPERQQKEIDKHRDVLVGDDWWYEDVLENWYTKLEKEGFDVPNGEIKFDDFDVAFKARVDVIRFLNTHDKDEKLYPRIKEHYKKDLFNISIEHNGRACFPGAMTVNTESYYDDDHIEDEDVQDLVASAMEGGALVIDKIAELGDWIEETAKTRAREISKELRENYEFYISDEAIKDHLISNDVEFE